MSGLFLRFCEADRAMYRAAGLGNARWGELLTSEDTVEIYLTRPGGQPEGPYSLEEINQNLAAKKYRDTDFWAWYHGEKDWVPLYRVPGVVSSDDAVAWGVEPAAQDRPTEEAAETAIIVGTEPAISEAEPNPPSGQSGDTVVLKNPESPPPQPDGAPEAAQRDLSTGLPFGALAHVFLLTTGDGPTASRSSVTGKMLEQSVGEPLGTIRANVPRDAIAHCSFVQQLRTKGELPPAAWKAMASFKADLVQDARAGQYKVCVRTFPIESGDLVCLFLFYNKQKM